MRGDVGVLFLIHPNPEVSPVMDRILGDRPSIVRIPPLDYPHFDCAPDLCDLALTDSGGVQEELPAQKTAPM